MIRVRAEKDLDMNRAGVPTRTFPKGSEGYLAYSAPEVVDGGKLIAAFGVIFDSCPGVTHWVADGDLAMVDPPASSRHTVEEALAQAFHHTASLVLAFHEEGLMPVFAPARHSEEEA